MDLVFVVPGIMGSELWLDGQKLWPPRFLHNVERPEDLLDENIEVGDIIRRVLIVGFYDKLLEPLKEWGYAEGTNGERGLLVPWPYHWLKGVPENASRLAQAIRARLKEHPRHEVVVLAHSMGGLVATYALECLEEEDPSWRARVRLLVTFGTPFLGAPASLFNAFGIEGVIGITASDCETLMADARFPSAYQLLPHLHTRSSWEPWPPLSPVPHYQSLAPDGPLLGEENLRAALALQEAFKRARPNPNTRKFNFCGASYGTVWGVQRAADPEHFLVPVKSKAGDGTVPSWSGRQDSAIQFAPLGAKHSGTFGDKQLLATLRLLLAPPSGPGGGESGVPPGLGPKPSPVFQPRVSVTRNAISSRRREIEIEIAEPPNGGELSLSWLGTKDIETPEDLAAAFAQKGLLPVGATTTMRMSPALDYPMTVTMPGPPYVGQFALAAWAGVGAIPLSDLDSSRMDVVWYFADNRRDPGTTPGSGREK